MGEQSVDLLRRRLSSGDESGRAFVRDLLLGRRALSVGRVVDVFPEDLIIEMLTAPSSPSERTVLVSGCSAAFAEVLRSVANDEVNAELTGSVVRICRVVDVSAPDELQRHAEALLRLTLGGEGPPEILRAAARAAARFADESSIALWREGARHRHIASYAFNVLLTIEKRSSVLAETLAELWVSKLRRGWTTDCVYLSRKAGEVQGQHLLERLFAILRRELVPAELDILRKEMVREAWSAPWVDFLDSRLVVTWRVQHAVGAAGPREIMVLDRSLEGRPEDIGVGEEPGWLTSERMRISEGLVEATPTSRVVPLRTLYSLLLDAGLVREREAYRSKAGFDRWDSFDTSTGGAGPVVH